MREIVKITLVTIEDVAAGMVLETCHNLELRITVDCVV
jgi:hypothetical protein